MALSKNTCYMVRNNPQAGCDVWSMVRWYKAAKVCQGNISHTITPAAEYKAEFVACIRFAHVAKFGP